MGPVAPEYRKYTVDEQHLLTADLTNLAQVLYFFFFLLGDENMSFGILAKIGRRGCEL